MAHPLGHQQCIDIFLRPANRTTLLLLGLGVAAQTNCHGVSHGYLRHSVTTWSELWDFVCTVCGAHSAISLLLCFHALEEQQGGGQKSAEADDKVLGRWVGA